MRKIKVLHLIECLERGGAQRRLVNDLKLINKDRFSNVVFCIRNGMELSKEIEALGIEVYLLEDFSKGHFGKLLYLIRYLKKNKIDILHSQIFWADIYGRIAGKIAGVKHIVSTIQGIAHDPGIPFAYSFKQKFLDIAVGKIAGTKYIAVSEFVKDYIARTFRVNKKLINVIYNYVDCKRWQTADPQAIKKLRQEFRLRDDEHILITVGRLEPPKGHIYVLKAMPAILRERPVKYLIVGDGCFKEELLSIARELNIEEHVIFTGERRDVMEIVHLSDIFVFPTLTEGLSLALLEAMVAGISCIATSIPPNLEIIEDKVNGLTVAPQSTEDIINAVLFLIKNVDESKRLRLEAQKTVRTKFSGECNVKMLENYYLSFLNSQAA